MAFRAFLLSIFPACWLSTQACGASTDFSLNPPPKRTFSLFFTQLPPKPKGLGNRVFFFLPPLNDLYHVLTLLGTGCSGDPAALTSWLDRRRSGFSSVGTQNVTCLLLDIWLGDLHTPNMTGSQPPSFPEHCRASLCFLLSGILEAIFSLFEPVTLACDEASCLIWL